MNKIPAAAPQNTKCAPAGHACATGKDAVHMVDGRPLCAFHSPYDVVEANGKTSMENYLARFDARQEAAQEQEQEPTEVDSDSSTWSEARKEAYRQETAKMMANLSRSMDESHARMAGPVDTRPHAQAYSQYISDGIGDTDGWFSPLSYEAWVTFFAPQD